MVNRMTAVLISALATFWHSPALSQTAESKALILVPTDDGTVLDEFPFDGFGNALDSEFVVVNLTSVDPLSEALSDRRGVMEFDISSMVGRHVQRAILKLRPTVISVPAGSFVVPVEVRRYEGNGVLGLADFHRGAFVTAFDMRSIPIDRPTNLDLTRPFATRFRTSGRISVLPFGQIFKLGFPSVRWSTLRQRAL